jgi:hypothetical protein
VVTNSSRGIWSLNKTDVTSVDPKDVLKTVIENDKKAKQGKTEIRVVPVANEIDPPEEAWFKKL